LEVNIAPGMTETSLVPQAIEAAGLNVGGVFSDLVTQAVTRSH
jgi:D-alanine-D-alanine ligase